MVSKAKLLDMINTDKGDIKKEVARKNNSFENLLRDEEEILAVKQDYRNEYDNLVTMQISLALDQEAKIQRNISRMRSLHDKSQYLLTRLERTYKKGAIIQHSVEIGFNKAHVELLKAENATMRGLAEGYRRTAKDYRDTLNVIDNEIAELVNSINNKRMQLDLEPLDIKISKRVRR